MVKETNDIINTFLKQNKADFGVNENMRAFFSQNENNTKVTGHIANLNELRAYISLKFTNLKAAAIAAGISHNRVRQILIGYNVPVSAKLIEQIADGWGINQVKLAQLFEHLRALK